MKANRLPHLILTIALIVSSAAAAKAQVMPGSSRNGGLPSGEGNIMLQGRIHFPSGQSATGRTIKVSLESINSFGGGNTAVPDQDGVFRFNGLTPGDYTVVVDAGPEFEKAREPVGIYAGTSGRVVQVTIQLSPRIDASNPLFAGIPSNALNLYQKAFSYFHMGLASAMAWMLFLAILTLTGANFALGKRWVHTE